MKVAIVHDWLTGMRGGERVLEVLCELFPDAPIYTLIHHRGAMSPMIEGRKIIQSSLPSWPLAQKHFRVYLPYFPKLIEKFDLSSYDLVISSSHCVAKGVIPAEGAIHICYCHTPMRYVWDLYDDYLRERGPLAKAFLTINRRPLQRWDRRSSERVGHFIANSRHVADRISRHYGRESTVIYPPVDVDFFTPGDGESGDYYLIVSALVPYKRVDLAVKAFSGSGRRLVVIGTGSDEKRITGIASAGVEFLGNVDDKTLLRYYRGARALIFPGEEDFGITPLEAMACGRPVIAYGKGGAMETVQDGVTGLFFHEQTAEALMGAVDNFERISFTKDRARQRALEFSRPKFMNKIKEFIESRCRETLEGVKGAQRS